jgi:hypothetical protein
MKIKIRLAVRGMINDRIKLIPMEDEIFIPAPDGMSYQDLLGFAFTINLDHGELMLETSWDEPHKKGEKNAKIKI